MKKYPVKKKIIFFCIDAANRTVKLKYGSQNRTVKLKYVPQKNTFENLVFAAEKTRVAFNGSSLNKLTYFGNNNVSNETMASNN